MSTRWSKGFVCIECGSPRSDQSRGWCGECVKKHRGVSADDVANLPKARTTEWESEGGCLVRRHGDVG